MRSLCIAVALALPLGMLAQSNIIFTASRSLKNISVVDTAQYIIQYSYAHRFGAKHIVPEQDVVLLEIGKKVAKSYSYNLYQCDSLADVWAKEGRRVSKNYSSYTQREVLYISIEDKTISTLYRSFSDSPMPFYQEDIPPIAWAMGQEKKQVLGYECRQATARYRGRSYTAWFAPDIPLPLGPWRFGKLPGLILEIYDATGEVRFVAEGIRRSRVPIVVWNWPHQPTTRAKARQSIARMFKQPANYLKAIGGGQVLYTPSGPLDNSFSCIYNPIELE